MLDGRSIFIIPTFESAASFLEKFLRTSTLFFALPLY